MAIFFGLDPSSGANSRLGVAAFESTDKELILFEGLEPDKLFKKDFTRRVKSLQDQLDSLVVYLGEPPVVAGIESTVMAGRGGESLARATGAFMTCFDYDTDVDFINNGTVKKTVGGHGKAEKLEVALGVLKWSESNPKTHSKVKAAIEAELFDQLDALAIAICAEARHNENKV